MDREVKEQGKLSLRRVHGVVQHLSVDESGPGSPLRQQRQLDAVTRSTLVSGCVQLDVHTNHGETLRFRLAEQPPCRTGELVTLMLLDNGIQAELAALQGEDKSTPLLVCSAWLLERLGMGRANRWCHRIGLSLSALSLLGGAVGSYLGQHHWWWLTTALLIATYLLGKTRQSQARELTKKLHQALTQPPMAESRLDLSRQGSLIMELESG